MAGQLVMGSLSHRPGKLLHYIKGAQLESSTPVLHKIILGV